MKSLVGGRAVPQLALKAGPELQNGISAVVEYTGEGGLGK